jgi:hypothetical protein
VCRDEVGPAAHRLGNACFEREVMDHYRLVFEKV